MKKTLIILLFPVMIAGPAVFGQDIRLIDKIPVSQQDGFIEADDGMAVLPNGSFIICDTRAGNFKIFDKTGRLIKIFGRRGNGPDEFSYPTLFDYSDNKLLISDSEKYRILVYHVNEDLEIKLGEEFFGSCCDARIFPDHYLFSGSKADPAGKWYEIYLSYPRQKDFSFLLTLQDLFNISPNAGQPQLAEKASMGVRSYCDSHGDQVYAVWEALLSVIRVDTKTNKQYRFGNKTSLYTAPVASKELIQAKKERNLKKHYKILHKYSMIRKLFVTDRYVGIVYMNYDREIDLLNPIVQLYSLDGIFIMEKKLDEVTYPHRLMSLYYDKKTNVLSALSLKIDDLAESHYTLLKYQIIH